LSSSGVLAGIPLAAGTYMFIVRASSGVQWDAQALSLTVGTGTPPVTLTPTQFCSQFAPTAIATFADAQLEFNVRVALGFTLSQPITCGDLLTVTVLNLSGDDVFDLAGIQNLANLQVADLGEQEISDASWLSTLTSLTFLDLENNDVTDLTPLAGLTALTYLQLEDNGITDISPLAGLTLMESLVLSENVISDISALAGMTALIDIDLGENAITDLAPLGGLTNLATLDVAENFITDLDGLAGLTGLTYLEASQNDITSISGVAGLNSLTTLYLYDNRITDVTALSALPALQSIGLSNNASLSTVASLVANPGIGSGDNVDVSDTSVPCSEVTQLEAKLVTVFDTCGAPPGQITTTSLPGGSTGVSYSASLAVTGGTPPHEWFLETGSLPPGLVLSPTGSISGVPSLPGTYQFGVIAFSSDFQSFYRALSITVVAGTPNLLGRWVDVSGSPITFATVGQRVRLQVCATRADLAAFQSQIRGFASRATAVTVAGLNSAAGSGVHPTCAGTLDVLDTGLTASGTSDPITVLIASSATAAGTGTVGIFEITFDLTAIGALSIQADPSDIIAVDFNGLPIVLIPDIANLLIL
jgi:Leucine-rich repeat (LRR) protein